MEEEIWVHSRQLDPEEVRQTGCFTTLPVRIHKQDDIADVASRRLATEWAEVMGDGSKTEPACLYSDKGDYSSFFYPESRPERLGLMAYLTESAFIRNSL